jgi:branched-chain amino acid transport system ATP-binding protein
MLEVDKIDTFYGEFQVLRKVSVMVGDGELVVLLGPNGHGKSTLLKAICGLLMAASGSIRFNEEEIGRLPTERIVEMGITYVAEERHLFPQMSVIKNLRLGAYNRNAREKEKENLEYVFQLFPRLKERAQQFASTLSGGEGRMLALGRGLMSDAKLLAIDEPSFGLAPNLRSHVFKTIREINHRGISIILVEQNIPQVSDLADRIYLMEEGVITFEGDKQAALDNDHLREVFLGI